MSDQSLDKDEQINIRWAYDDPNPVAIKRVKVGGKQNSIAAFEQ